MSRRKKRNKVRASGKERLYNLAITALAVILVIITAVFIGRSTRASYDYQVEARDILNEIQDNDYATALMDVNNNRAQGIDENDDSSYAEPYAVVDYYDHQQKYLAYMAAGDTKMAEKHRIEREKARAGMGRLAYKATEIDTLLTK